MAGQHFNSAGTGTDNRDGWRGLARQMLRRAQSQGFYVADMLAGHASGLKCPSCGSPSHTVTIPKLGGLGSIYTCDACQVMFRPTALMMPAVASWYYGYVYGEQGIATTTAGETVEHEGLEQRIQQAGKDRSGLIREVTGDAQVDKVCVFGCSWGYEVKALRDAGFDAFGVELSEPRREFGRKHLGVDIYGSLDEALEARGPVDAILSSHVLEHIPTLGSVLDEMLKLQPRFQIHITPNVEPDQPSSTIRTSIGREHPLGVSRAFWEHRCHKLGQQLDFRVLSDETAAVVRAPASQA